MRNIIGTIYLLHFSKRYKHAGHYSGWTQNLEARLAEHASGRGARLLEVVKEAGITWQLARTWTGDRYLERRLKQKGAAARCPICQARKVVSTLVTKDWRHRAACRDADPELFFPLGDVFTTAELGQLAEAKAVCRGCPVRAECLAWACNTGLTHAVAGGMTEGERREIRLRARQAS
jgi:predicted GIY-YIG superfamily endonuclease